MKVVDKWRGGAALFPRQELFWIYTMMSAETIVIRLLLINFDELSWFPETTPIGVLVPAIKEYNQEPYITPDIDTFKKCNDGEFLAHNLYSAYYSTIKYLFFIPARSTSTGPVILIHLLIGYIKSSLSRFPFLWVNAITVVLLTNSHLPLNHYTTLYHVTSLYRRWRYV